VTSMRLAIPKRCATGFPGGAPDAENASPASDRDAIANSSGGIVVSIGTVHPRTGADPHRPSRPWS
jgi:hypothetical protein